MQLFDVPTTLHFSSAESTDGKRSASHVPYAGQEVSCIIFLNFLQNGIKNASLVFNRESTINNMVIQTCKDFSHSTQRLDNYTKMKKYKLI